ncbi:Suf-domain-containing protein [Athelia psychrophila]|uniref:mRNA 3'-end-processing protein RNA14 n=1 Tax=Athelia psychrophila TaxID=1759441 RepID=A0A166HQ04_9AGAM|nr:Suf-domain-containing protein [Fibularhizoctonia sp. CBS 109695]
MSEPPPPISPVESIDQKPQDEHGNDTLPIEETLQVLEQLDTAPNSQEDVLTPTTQQPKEEPKTPPAQLSEWQLLLDRLRDAPHDPEGWNRLVDLAENSGTLEEVKGAYDALLEVYPNTAQAQIAYIGHYADAGLFTDAQKLFRGALLASPAVELWRFYLTYVRRRNPGPEKRGVIRDAYEFALTRIGHDKDSGEIWMDYIQFLRAGEAATTWDEQQKMDALRKVYHRAVQIPLENIEQLWSELEAFESNLNKITAKKFMADLSPSYMQARTVLRQLQRHLGPLFPPPPPPSASGRQSLYLPSLPTFNSAERALVGAWKTYLKWEEGNPLELDENDKAILTQRIQSIYRKAVCRMRYYGEIWYMWYVWHSNIGTIDRTEAITVLKEGIKANPASFLLNFAYAEALEAKGDKEAIAAAYEKFTDILRADLEALESRIDSANSSLESADGTSAPAAPNGQSNGLAEPGSQSTNSSFETQASNEKPPKSKELAEKRTEYGLVWIMYMRAARRMDNQAAARAVFGKCRKDRWVPWEVYEASALMEYHVCNSKPVAVRIFEKGLELFADEVEFVLRYLGFLISLNDDQNARALFERVITTFPSQAARPIWERWARYEYQYGDLASAQRLEKRISEVFPNDPPIKRFAQRHIYLGTDAIAARDLGFALARQAGPNQPTGNPLARTETQSMSNLNNVPGSSSSNNKRPASPDYRKREDRPPADHGPAHKRARPMSPVRDRDRGDRWEGPPRRRGSPSYDRERERDVPPRRMEREHPEEKPVTIPPVISWFVGQLPTPAAFNGPIFRADDLMMLLRNAVIPSARPRSPPPPPPRAGGSGGGRPPPDYGPYQGPGGGRGGRRY